MTSKKTLNAKNLEALGAQRLAELLIEISARDGSAKRRLRLELAGAESPSEVAKEVHKRLAMIARSRSFVDWQNRRALVDDLETQRRAIIGQVGRADPAGAVDLMWRFLALANSIFERCDDSSGTVVNVFHSAAGDLGEIAKAAKADPYKLAEETYQALIKNDYGQYDNLISVLTPALGREGLEHLKQRMIDLSNAPIRKPANKERVEIGWSSAGPIYEDEIAERSRVSTVRIALMEIADAQGDVNSFIGQYDEETRKIPNIAAEIAQRLLAAGRVEEAWQTIEATVHRRSGSWDWPDFEWERLADFDDFEAEERALNFAQRSGTLLQALSFLVSWPALERAANLVIQRADELDGDHYEILTPAANALAGKYPLAATLVLRAMIDFSLTNARSSRYKHAARHLLDCSSLSSAVGSFGVFETHDAYEVRLRREHGKKLSFWSLVV
ncbi:MAG: hypothetical protein P8Y71_19290 [Pseudolabrys sp.]